MLKAMIFDLDGTVGNTLPLCIAAFQRAIAPLTGAVPSEGAIAAFFGPSEEGVLAAFVPGRLEEALEAYQRHYRELHDRYPAPFEHLPEVFDLLAKKGFLLSIVTGKGLGTAVITFERYGLGKYFTELETGAAAGSRKLAGMRAVLDKHGLSPDEAVYVGDAPSDVDIAREAGMGCYAAAWAETADAEALRGRAPAMLFRTTEAFRDHVARLDAVR